MADKNLNKDQERLAKLWDAYESQEKELELAMKKIATLEHKIEEMDRVNTVLKKAVEDRDSEVRDLELKVISMEEDKSKFEPKFDEVNRLYKEEKERYSKLFAITEELEEDLAKAKAEIEIKDKWFDQNVGMLENIREAIIDRNVKVENLKTSTFTGSTESKPETGKEEKEEEKVTFKTVKVEKEKKEGEPETGKDEIIPGFAKLPNVDDKVAECLYDGGYTEMAKLKDATTEELAKLDGISTTLARKIKTDLETA